MNCEQWRDQAMDVLYGEEVRPSRCYEFFRHLEGCSECDREYRELLEARELLGSWDIEETVLPEGPVRPSYFSSIGGGVWRRAGFWARQAAAAVLITVGLFTLFQQARLLGEDRVEVSEQQLLEMVNDLIVEHEMAERRLIGSEWMNFADDLQLRQQTLASDVAHRLSQLEERYLEQLEEARNRQTHFSR